MRTAAAFVLGMVVGAAALAFGLWRIGALRTYPASPESQAPAPSAPAGLPQLGAVQQPPLVPPPSQLPPPQQILPQQAPPRGEAERTIPESTPPYLAMPIAGVNPATLPDTFHEVRDGHEHEALDILAPRGTPVHVVAEGNVVKLFTSKEGGLTVYQFDDSRTRCFYYAHLDHYAPGLREGMLLRRGDVLGYVGTTGDAAGGAPHLHFAVFKLGPEKEWWKGTAIDPLPLLNGRQR